MYLADFALARATRSSRWIRTRYPGRERRVGVAWDLYEVFIGLHVLLSKLVVEKFRGEELSGQDGTTKVFG